MAIYQIWVGYNEDQFILNVVCWIHNGLSKYYRLPEGCVNGMLVAGSGYHSYKPPLYLVQSNFFTVFSLGNIMVTHPQWDTLFMGKKLCWYGLDIYPKVTHKCEHFRSFHILVQWAYIWCYPWWSWGSCYRWINASVRRCQFGPYMLLITWIVTYLLGVVRYHT